MGDERFVRERLEMFIFFGFIRKSWMVLGFCDEELVNFCFGIFMIVAEQKFQTLI